MVAEPLVHIILVNWNGKDVTLDCLASLHKVPYRNKRVVVVDNDSSDGSVVSIRYLFPDATILEMNSNLRFAGGNNIGMRFALEHEADLIMLLNNDTIVDPGFLAPMIERLRSDPSIGMVAPKIYYHEQPERIWFAGGTFSMWTGTMSHTGIREIDAGQHDEAIPINYATGCCILIRKEVVHRVGMLDESYFMYAEDADWSQRVRNAGYTIWYEPQAKVWHKLSVASGGHTSWFKMKHKFVSNFRFFARHGRWYHWLTFPWLNIAVNAFAAARYIGTRNH